MNFYRMNKRAVAPKRATAGSACYDLYSCFGQGGEVTKLGKREGDTWETKPVDEYRIINPGERTAIPTGIVLDIPEGHVVKVFARSGLSFKNGVSLANCVGIIDHDYREELFVLLQNNSKETFVVNHGDRIAQMMLEKVLNYELLETDERPAKIETREGGIGSTGVK